MKIIEKACQRNTEGMLEECVNDMVHISFGNNNSNLSLNTSDGEVGNSNGEERQDNLPKSSGHELPFMRQVKHLNDSDSDN